VLADLDLHCSPMPLRHIKHFMKKRVKLHILNSDLVGLLVDIIDERIIISASVARVTCITMCSEVVCFINSVQTLYQLTGIIAYWPKIIELILETSLRCLRFETGCHSQ
jgi:uncharacterized membrane protein